MVRFGIRGGVDSVSGRIDGSSRTSCRRCNTRSVSFDPYAPYGPLVESTVRIATWNVWGRYGENWRERQAGIEDELLGADPDIVCLVEAWRQGETSQPELVAEHLVQPQSPRRHRTVPRPPLRLHPLGLAPARRDWPPRQVRSPRHTLSRPATAVRPLWRRRRPQVLRPRHQGARPTPTRRSGSPTPAG